MEEIIIQRITQILADKKLSVNQFSKEIGMEQTTVNRQINGQRGLSLAVVYAILHKYPEISAEWLMRGTGTMYAQPGTDNGELIALRSELHGVYKALELMGVNLQPQQPKRKSVG